MDARISFSNLKYIADFVALDFGTFIVELLAMFALNLLGSTGSEAAQVSSLANADIVITWTIRALRIVIWALAIVAFSQLLNVGSGFGWASIWFALRVVVFSLVSAVDGMIEPLGSGIPVEYLSLPISVGIIILVGVAVSPLLPALGCFSALQADADILRSCGAERQARTCQRDGLLFVAAGSVFALCSVTSISSILMPLITNPAVALSTFADSPLGSLTIFSALAALLVGAAYLVLWALSAVRMRQTYGLIKELAA